MMSNDNQKQEWNTPEITALTINCDTAGGVTNPAVDATDYS